MVSSYRAKLEAVPLREQEVADLERDYAISKEHYGQLLDKKLSADTAAQLEVRQKGEKFTILDPAQVAEKPSSPNRMLIDVAGVLVGLALGLSSTFVMDFFGMSITSVARSSPQQLIFRFSVLSQLFELLSTGNGGNAGFLPAELPG